MIDADRAPTSKAQRLLRFRDNLNYILRNPRFEVPQCRCVTVPFNYAKPAGDAGGGTVSHCAIVASTRGSKELGDTWQYVFEAPKVTFPDRQYFPADRLKIARLSKVTLHGRAAFICPERSIRGGCDPAPFAAVRVPKTTIDEDHPLLFRKGDVWRAGQRLYIGQVAIAHSMQATPQDELRFGVLRKHTTHVEGTLLLRKYIDHSSTLCLKSRRAKEFGLGDSYV